VTKAVLLTGANAEDRAKQAVAAHPNRFVRFASVDVAQSDAIDRLRTAVKTAPSGLAKSNRRSRRRVQKCSGSMRSPPS
jgi:hypothetical protein